MDPQENIKRQRELVQRIPALCDSEGQTWDETDLDVLVEIAEVAIELADLVQALDKWRTIGGYDPYMKER